MALQVTEKVANISMRAFTGSNHIEMAVTIDLHCAASMIATMTGYTDTKSIHKTRTRQTSTHEQLTSTEKHTKAKPNTRNRKHTVSNTRSETEHEKQRHTKTLTQRTQQGKPNTRSRYLQARNT